jgi:hypothetical protein
MGKDEKVCRVGSDGSVDCKPVKHARVKSNAASIFWKKFNRDRNPRAPIPRETSEFGDRLKEISGKTFVVDREYDNRVVLQYPPEMVYPMPNGRGKVVAIDMEKDLVEMV